MPCQDTRHAIDVRLSQCLSWASQRDNLLLLNQLCHRHARGFPGSRVSNSLMVFLVLTVGVTLLRRADHRQLSDHQGKRHKPALAAFPSPEPELLLAAHPPLNSCAVPRCHELLDRRTRLSLSLLKTPPSPSCWRRLSTLQTQHGPRFQRLRCHEDKHRHVCVDIRRG